MRRMIMGGPERDVSECQLQRELHRAGAAHLIERAEDSQGSCERSSGLAKVSFAKVRIDVSKIGMIENVEGLGAKLQFQPLVDGKLPADCHVPLPGPEAAHEVTGSIAKAGSRRRKGVWVDGPAARTHETIGVHSGAL